MIKRTHDIHMLNSFHRLCLFCRENKGGSEVIGSETYSRLIIVVIGEPSKRSSTHNLNLFIIYNTVCV
jgi:hypothetical protein